ncbi:MAG TPA: pyruvate kinase [Phycisphaerae bacterium]
MRRTLIRTKIIATAGPASRAAHTLAALLEHGVDCVRLNFSHGTQAEHAEIIGTVRRIAAEQGISVAIMGDLCGPKIRMGAIADSDRELKAGEHVEIVTAPTHGTAHRFGTNLPELVQQARSGDRVLIDDGQIRLRVTAQSADRLICVCEIGGLLGDHKGINLPDTSLATCPLTEKDLRDLDFAVQQQLDYVALSFIQRGSDIQALRSELQRRGGDQHIISKIETPQAVQDIESIIAASDLVLVARGDLGVQMDLAVVPLVQKDIARRCRAAGKPVIIATQMLQSMVTSPNPTRAEVSDVANAILDDADAVMLSAETAIGRHPVEAVEVVQRVAAETERFLDTRAQRLGEAALAGQSAPAGDGRVRHLPNEGTSVREAVAAGAAWLTAALRPAVVCVWTASGATARRVSKQRVPAPILGLTPQSRIAQRLALYYGVVPLLMNRPASDAQMIAMLERHALEDGWAVAGEVILIVAGSSAQTGHSSHAIFLHQVQPAPPDV